MSRSSSRRPLFSVLALAVWGIISGSSDPASAEESLGVVHLPSPCTAEARPHLERGLALLHHMTYLAAEEAFRQAAEADPECSLAYWGQAMTFLHPLWPDRTAAEKRAEGEKLLAQASAARHRHERDAAFAKALAAYYQGEERSERERLAAYLAAWREVHGAFPEDPEVASFHALALLANASAEDKSYARQKEAGALLEEVLKRHPRHPGAHHYLIHAYDFPPLAEQALGVARSYDDVAPENSHALHMTSHIFTRLGMWPESIELNRRAAAVSRERTPGGGISMHHLHALDYLAYAHLQRADVVAARQVLTNLDALEPPYQDHPAVAYSFAAVPVRLALETQDWKAAAELPPRVPPEVDWNRYPFLEALPHFARALGAARSGKAAQARKSLARLAELEAAARAQDGAYDWGIQVGIQRRAAEAWLAYEEGEVERGLELARQAAELESTTEKNPVTPGEVLPARELYGDMLLAAGRPKEALAAFQVALERSPGRFNSLYGAGRSAEAARQSATAAGYYRRLLEICPEPTGQKARIAHAQAFLEENR